MGHWRHQQPIFAKVSGEFFLDQPGQYRFRTFNDDGVFLLVDGKLVINDPTLHPSVFLLEMSICRLATIILNCSSLKMVEKPL